MRIATKIALALLVVTASMIAFFYFWQRPQLIENFRTLQRDKAVKDVERSRDAVLTELGSLSKQAQDWASWDDTYQFVQDENKRYSSVNLSNEVFEVSHFDLICIVSSKGKVVFSASKLPSGKIVKDIPNFSPISMAFGTKRNQGPALDKNVNLNGIDYVAGTPIALCVRPITDSSETKPSRGALFLGRYLTPAVIDQMSNAVKVPFKLLDPIRARLEGAPSTLEKGRPSVDRPSFGKNVVAFASMVDTAGKPLMVVRSESKPDVLAQGYATVSRIARSFIVSSVLIALLAMVFIHLSVSHPLERLAEQVAAIDDENLHRATDLPQQRTDEIGTVGRSFHELVCRLQVTRSRLMHAAREAGMADVARGVLHNAGNVLNSLTVSVHQVEQLSSRSNAEGIRKALTLIKEHDGSLDAYLARDPKGSKILPYLESLANKIDAEQQEVSHEAANMMKSVTHLGSIVQAQVEHAAKPERSCVFRLSDVVDQLLGIMSSSLERHGISMRCEVEDALYLTGDPSKLLQVLVNLVTNAKDAVKDQAVTEPCVALNVSSSAAGDVEIRISDNGVGIADEDLEKIFAASYSTKVGGTGIGLHFSANAAAEMGWTLVAHSDGLGKGATFVLAKSAASEARAA